VEHLAVSHSKGSALNLEGNVRATKKELPDTNTLAYFVAATMTKKKSFIILTKE
jgi:hypothetical protein